MSSEQEPIYHIFKDLVDQGTEEWEQRFHALYTRCQSLPGADAVKISNDVRTLTVDAIQRHYKKHQENLTRFDLSKTDKARLFETVGRVSHAAESVLWLGMKATQILDANTHSTLEVLGRPTFGARTGPMLSRMHTVLGEQFARFGSSVGFESLQGTDRAKNRYYFFPYYDDPYRGNFNYDKGFLEVRHPMADGVIRNGARLNVFGKREVMISLDRTDEFTREVLMRIGDRAWGHEASGDYVRVDKEASDVAGAAYERFHSAQTPELTDIFPIREQVLARAWLPDA